MGILDLVKLGLILMAALFLGSLVINFGLTILAGILVGANGIYGKFAKKGKAAGILAVAIATIAILFFGNVIVGAFREHPQKTPSDVASQTTGGQCTLQNDSFVAELNGLRSSLGLKAVTEDADLDTVANLRLADMRAYQYYGHVNPTTKLDVWPLVQAHTSYQHYGEDLDGPLSASQAFTNFKNSPEHYLVLTNKDITSVGIASTFMPGQFNAYDDKGNQLPASDAGRDACIVVVDVAF